MASAFIALGSNLGDRRSYLEQALRRLGASAGIRVIRVSSFHETPPEGGPAGQGMYLNAAAELETDLTPLELLRILLRIEAELGRDRVIHHGPRTIDLDLLLVGDSVLNGPELTLPHPRMHQRSFVLLPLLEIAPTVLHPLLGTSIAELTRRLVRGRPLAGKRTLITGSTSGIGRAMALAFAAAGADVIVHGRRSPQAAEELSAKLKATGVRSGSLMADLRRMEECLRLAEAAWSLWDGLDILVNNAGADLLTGEAAHWLFERKLQELLSVDLAATMFLGRAVGRRMLTAGQGVILNMGWDQAETGMEGDSGQLFGAVKGAVMAFTRSLAASLAPQVRVNCLAPGWIRTSWAETASKVWQERAVRESLLGRWGTPEDVAQTAVWLASNHASFVTGQSIRINGGAVRNA